MLLELSTQHSFRDPDEVQSILEYISHSLIFNLLQVLQVTHNLISCVFILQTLRHLVVYLYEYV